MENKEAVEADLAESYLEAVTDEELLVAFGGAEMISLLGPLQV